MMLVGLASGLSVTSKKPNKYNCLGRLRGCLSCLSLTDKQQAQKKVHEIKLVVLVGLVSPTEGRRGPTSPRPIRERSLFNGPPGVQSHYFKKGAA